MSGAGGPRRGPPPLAPFGLVLHHDGRWSHEGQPIRNRKLREKFDTSVRYLADEGKYVVQLGHFRGEIELEEAGFFVRDFDAPTGRVSLSDGSSEALDPTTLSLSPIDRALRCRVKFDLVAEGLLARFTHAAHAELMQNVDEKDGWLVLRLGGSATPLPDGL